MEENKKGVLETVGKVFSRCLIIFIILIPLIALCVEKYRHDKDMKLVREGSEVFKDRLEEEFDTAPDEKEFPYFMSVSATGESDFYFSDEYEIYILDRKVKVIMVADDRFAQCTKKEIYEYLDDMDFFYRMSVDRFLDDTMTEYNGAYNRLHDWDYWLPGRKYFVDEWNMEFEIRSGKNVYSEPTWFMSLNTHEYKLNGEYVVAYEDKPLSSSQKEEEGSSGSSASSGGSYHGFSGGDNNVEDYDDPEDFYYDNEDDYEDIDDAEDYWDEYHSGDDPW